MCLDHARKDQVSGHVIAALPAVPPCDPNVYIQYKVCQLEVLIDMHISFSILYFWFLTVFAVKLVPGTC